MPTEQSSTSDSESHQRQGRCMPFVGPRCYCPGVYHGRRRSIQVHRHATGQGAYDARREAQADKQWRCVTGARPNRAQRICDTQGARQSARSACATRLAYRRDGTSITGAERLVFHSWSRRKAASVSTSDAGGFSTRFLHTAAGRIALAGIPPSTTSVTDCGLKAGLFHLTRSAAVHASVAEAFDGHG